MANNTSMARPQHKHSWFNRKTVAWLLLPFIGLGIWLVTAWITNWVLSHSVNSTSQLQTSLYPTTQFTRTLMVSAIQARIDRNENIAEVTLTTENSSLESLEFKLPIIAPINLEKALSKELNVSPAAIQNLIQYQIH